MSRGGWGVVLRGGIVEMAEGRMEHVPMSAVAAFIVLGGTWIVGVLLREWRNWAIPST